jgi:DNA-binding transcriptional LysR family regulator
MINSEDLRFFCVLAQQDSLAATARILDVSPPSVTQRLQAIEEKLQLQLVNRKGRNTKLTDEGIHFYERAKLIVTELEDLESSLTSYKKDIVGRLRISAPFGFGHQFIAPLAAKFQDEHNNLSVELVLSDNPHQLNQEWDVLIHIGELRDSSLVKIVLAANQRYLCAAPSYLKKYGMPTSIAELRQHNCIALRENAEDVTLWKIQVPKEKKMQSLRIYPKLASNDGRVVKQWALDGYGIMLRSEWDIAEELSDGRLIRILPDHKLPSADVVALLREKASNRSARTTQFIASLKQIMSPPPWRV